MGSTAPVTRTDHSLQTHHHTQSQHRNITYLQTIISEGSIKAIITALCIVLAGLALTPFGMHPLLPPPVAAGILIAYALLSLISGILFARPRYPTLSRGLIFTGILSAVAGSALLDPEIAALQRATAIDTLLISTMCGLSTLHLWLELSSRARRISGGDTLTQGMRLWYLIYIVIIAGVILVPLVVPDFSVTTSVFQYIRLVPIAVGSALAVTLLDQGRRHPRLGRITEDLAWLGLIAQLGLLLSIIPYSLAWSSALAMMLAQLFFVARWIAHAHLSDAVHAGQTILMLEAENAHLHDLVAAATSPPLDTDSAGSGPSAGLAAKSPYGLAEGTNSTRQWVDIFDHDIKKAMTTVMLGASVLRDAIGGDTEQQADYARKVMSSSHRLERMLNLFLDFQRHQDRFPIMLAPQSVSVLTLVREVVNDEQFVRQHKISIVTGPPRGSTGHAPNADTKVRWDRTRIEELLVNLIDNAAKYSPQRTPIEVRLWLDTAEQVILAVTDQGRGMSPDVALQAFDPYYHHDEGQPGKGLGLSIVKAIAELHQGTVEVRSTPGQGTTIQVTMPIVAPATERATIPLS